MSGASALRNVIGGLFTQNCTGDLSVYYSAVGSFGGVLSARRILELDDPVLVA